MLYRALTVVQNLECPPSGRRLIRPGCEDRLGDGVIVEIKRLDAGEIENPTPFLLVVVLQQGLPGLRSVTVVEQIVDTLVQVPEGATDVIPRLSVIEAGHECAKETSDTKQLSPTCS